MGPYLIGVPRQPPRLPAFRAGRPLSVRYILVGILTHVSFVPWSACARLIPWNAILEGPHTLRPMVHHDSWSSFLARLRIRVDPKLPHLHRYLTRDSIGPRNIFRSRVVCRQCFAIEAVRAYPRVFYFFLPKIYSSFITPKKDNGRKKSSLKVLYNPLLK